MFRPLLREWEQVRMSPAFRWVVGTHTEAEEADGKFTEGGDGLFGVCSVQTEM